MKDRNLNLNDPIRTREVEVRLRSGALEVTHGTIHTQSFSQSTRMKRAVKMLTLGWAGALLCVFLPVAHFILVPFCLIAAPFAALAFYRMPSLILESTVTCPKCSSPLSVSQTPEKWPIPELCTKCHSEVHIVCVSETT